MATVAMISSCSSPEPTATPVPVEVDDDAAGAAPVAKAPPTISVYPSVMRWPQGRSNGAGVWIMGSGLEPGQWFELWAGVNGVDDDIASFGLEGASLRQANQEGAFALGFSISGRVEREDLETILMQSPLEGPVTVSLVDMDTREVLATTPWLICGREPVEPWCASAQDVLILAE
ncbi:MAG: hypothetical protein OXL97_05720 [Chloroflexota bacterium]|nr:hypothetical protein [Chloroflexota bacterium]